MQHFRKLCWGVNSMSLRIFGSCIALWSCLWGCNGIPEIGGTEQGGQGGQAGQGGATGIAGDAPTPQSVMLAQAAGDAPIDACPNGGILVQFGVDTNANGELDADEVTREQ